jgi:hypothetical protein
MEVEDERRALSLTPLVIEAETHRPKPIAFHPFLCPFTGHHGAFGTVAMQQR